MSEYESDVPILAHGQKARPLPLAWLGVGVVGLIMGGLYWGILRDLIWQWWDDANYSHGFLVPLFSGFLIWRRRSDLMAVVPQGSWAGLVVLLDRKSTRLNSSHRTISY